MLSVSTVGRSPPPFIQQAQLAREQHTCKQNIRFTGHSDTYSVRSSSSAGHPPGLIEEPDCGTNYLLPRSQDLTASIISSTVGLPDAFRYELANGHGSLFHTQGHDQALRQLRRSSSKQEWQVFINKGAGIPKRTGNLFLLRQNVKDKSWSFLVDVGQWHRPEWLTWNTECEKQVVEGQGTF